ncbi:sigma-54-dependent Fis family transcriptional regulator [Aneurinibacillus terranovensis]|uniref:sigma-54-dependent Fis family transcriptional regulator n=1 Tax=Aneurinibacillus terranovensis TaxID=278991 RepID=UPI000423472C|nr:sigma-54-dependent Fis family transcriptional regulator [Aneurinibacillus terranovensis]
MEPVRIGFLFSLTGTTSLTEVGQYQAALYALNQFQYERGNLDFTFTYEVRDIQSDPRESYRHALEMAQSGIKIFVGCYTSACRKAVLPVLEAYDCLLVYPTLYEGQEIHPNVFYIGEVPNQQITSLLQFMVQQFGRRVYLIGNDYIYPRYTNQQIREMLQNMNGGVVGEQYVPLGYTQFVHLFQDIQLASPHVILSTLVGESVLHFYRTYYEWGFNPEKMPIFSPITTELEIQSMGTKYAAGHYSCASYFQSIDTVENRMFVEGMRKLYGANTVVSSVMASTYSGVQMILHAIVHLQSAGRKQILNYLYRKSFSSPGGRIQVDSNHHISREVRIGRANLDGQFSIIWSSKQPIPAKPLMTNMILNEPKEESIWKSVVETLAQEINHGIVVIDDDRTVLYVNSSAFSILRAQKGDLLEEDHLQELVSTYEWVERWIDDDRRVGIILLKKKEQVPTLGKKPLVEEYQFGRIVTWSRSFQKELHVAKIASQSDANVLILGETGSGKEVMARTIHEQSPRCKGPFVALNAGAIPRELISSELFGYVEGAFTGSRRGGSIGKLEAADGGTLFLDEIGEMPFELQVSLLRVLEERKVVRIGENRERLINVRVIAATNRNLKEQIAYQGTFRSDLYYRLNVFTIHAPPLRQRIEDIEYLSAQFLNQMQQHYGKGPLLISRSALKVLQEHPWPGNVRELRNIIERAFHLAIDEPEILPRHFPEDLQHSNRVDLKPSAVNLREIEKQLIEQVLHESSSVSEAARKLGITRSTLYRKMSQWNIYKVNKSRPFQN